MPPPDWLDVRSEVAAAVRDGRPVVALESTLIAHGLPWPVNVETARDAEAAVRAAGAVPATVAVLAGRPTLGLTDDEVVSLARAAGVRKAARRDLASAIADGATAATTVSATMALAHAAGVEVFATGGIGGVHHPGPGEPGPSADVSSDLTELGRTPVLVVCAGAKGILDLPRTLEWLETLGVPVVGLGCDRLPAFYVRDSGLPLPARVETPEQAARLWAAHRAAGGGTGALLTVPAPEAVSLTTDEFESALRRAELLAVAEKVRGPAVTPFLLARLAELTGGRTLTANRGLIVANAAAAAAVALALSRR
jgi:pseudouridine-5'-phosphate glycosidase